MIWTHFFDIFRVFFINLCHELNVVRCPWNTSPHPHTPTTNSVFVVSASRTRTKESATLHARCVRKLPGEMRRADKISEQHNDLMKNSVTFAHSNILALFRRKSAHGAKNKNKYFHDANHLDVIMS